MTREQQERAMALLNSDRGAASLQLSPGEEMQYRKLTIDAIRAEQSGTSMEPGQLLTLAEYNDQLASGRITLSTITTP